MGSLILASYVLRTDQGPARPRSERDIRSYYRRAYSGAGLALVLAAVVGLGAAASFLGV